MKNSTTKLLSFCLAVGMAIAMRPAIPEDIDIFAVDENSIVARPNILIVLDNSANWSRQSQQWPESEQQGQSEVAAIKQAISTLDDSVNIGLMEFITGGNASDEDSGYVRAHIRPMNATNKATLNAKLDKIYADINTPEEKRPQSNPFGTLFWDVYNYLAGVNHSNGGTGTPASLASPSAYQTQFSLFRSPLTSSDTCTRTVVIFIGNNVSAGPSPDSAANVAALKALAGGGSAGDAAVVQIPFADYTVTSVAAKADLGYSTSCFSSVAACSTASNNTACTDAGFENCACNSTAPIACPSTHWNVVGTTNSQTATVTSGPTTTTTVESTNDTLQLCKTGGQISPLDTSATCPSSSDNGAPTSTTPTGTYTRTQSSWASCKYVAKDQTGCSGSSKYNWENRGSHTVTTTTYNVVTTSTPTTLGETAACYNDAATCSTTGFNCSGFNGGCACTTAGSTSGCGAGNTSRFKIDGNYHTLSAVQLGTYHTAPSGPFMLDEWARFLRQTGVPIPGGTVRSQVTTYTIDVFNAQQHPDFSALLFNAARVGGGKYFQAKDKNSLINALKQIFNEVQAVNSAFSSASLPVNATNRAQNENQVFIGVFKPDRTKRPLWFGNLKRYQVVKSGSSLDLGDSTGASAINPNTGFITDCAVSFWTTDSTFNGVPYWKAVTSADPMPLSTCTTNTTDDLSDSPDGPFVEKGAAAEVLRKGNNPSATPDAAGNYNLVQGTNRIVYTRDSTTANGAALPQLTLAASGLAANSYAFAIGQDIKDEDVDNNLIEFRSTIHADVIHSRPQPINYGGSNGIVVFYGSNDGMYRAVKASNGQELWAFLAPEHYAKMDRLFKDDPPIRFFGDSPINTAPKDYFFDGSTTFFETFDSAGAATKVYLFLTMRRGGRKVYALDVTSQTSPKFLWAKGCDDAGVCDTGFGSIGQTWSQGTVGFIKGYSTTRPVLIFGGGYDPCDDDNSRTPCTASRGQGVYVVDAQDGTLVKYFDFSTLSGVGARGVAADVAAIDIDGDKTLDYVYALDTAGNAYRMDFIDSPSSRSPLAPSSWVYSRVAYTNGSARKFLFPPALVQASASMVYLAAGTGDREHPLMSQYPYGTDGSPGTAVLNRFYVWKDDLTDVDATTKLNLDDASKLADYTANQNCTAEKITPASTKQGWFKNLNQYGQGEQTVTSAAVVAGFLVFSTNRPTPPSTDSCTNSLGEARGYFVNFFNASGAIGVNGGSCGGTGSATFVGGGLVPSPVHATVPVNGKYETVLFGAVDPSGGANSAEKPSDPSGKVDAKRTPIYWYKSSGEK